MHTWDEGEDGFLKMYYVECVTDFEGKNWNKNKGTMTNLYSNM